VGHNGIASFIEGHRILLFDEGKFINAHMKRGQVGHEDVMQGVRKSALTEDLLKIDKIYLERNGDISPVKKMNDESWN